MCEKSNPRPSWLCVCQSVLSDLGLQGQQHVCSFPDHDSKRGSRKKLRMSFVELLPNYDCARPSYADVVVRHKTSSHGSFVCVRLGREKGTDVLRCFGDCCCTGRSGENNTAFG